MAPICFCFVFSYCNDSLKWASSLNRQLSLSTSTTVKATQLLSQAAYFTAPPHYCQGLQYLYSLVYQLFGGIIILTWQTPSIKGRYHLIRRDDHSGIPTKHAPLSDDSVLFAHLIIYSRGHTIATITGKQNQPRPQ